MSTLSPKEVRQPGFHTGASPLPVPRATKQRGLPKGTKTGKREMQAHAQHFFDSPGHPGSSLSIPPTTSQPQRRFLGCRHHAPHLFDSPGHPGSSQKLPPQPAGAHDRVKFVSRHKFRLRYLPPPLALAKACFLWGCRPRLARRARSAGARPSRREACAGPEEGSPNSDPRRPS